MLLGWIYHFMPRLLVIFAITALFIVCAVALIFRNVIGIVIPMLAGVLSAVWGFGLIALCGVNFNPLMVVLVILVGARALSHSVQTTRRYLEELFIAEGNRQKAARATIDGIFLASLSSLQSNMSIIGLKVFPAVVLGGMDSIAGAILGGLIVGLTENMAGGYLSKIFGSGVKELSAFFILLLILMIKPYGLFGKKEIIRL